MSEKKKKLIEQDKKDADYDKNKGVQNALDKAAKKKKDKK